ncbi:MAG: lipoate--protein ligase family protein [Paludibacter sp.]
MLIIQSHLHSTGFNLAAEEYLFSRREDEILFLYVNTPSVVIGSNQAILAEVDMDYCTENNISIFRRMSGGGAVFHDEGNLNYCFISNRKVGESALGADFLKPIVSVLKEFSVDVEIGKRKDLWLSGRYKISGTASHVGKTRELHHGTLLYDTDLDKLQKALSANPLAKQPKAIASVPSPVKNIKIWLQEKDQNAPVAVLFFQLFTHKLQFFFDDSNIDFLSNEESIQIALLQKSKYEDIKWTFKK